MAEGKSIATPTLTELSKELDSIVDWHLLGVKLGIKAHELGTINSNFHGNNVRCKHEMLGHWLENSENPTWKAVADALCLMEKHAVALQIREKHCSSPATTDTGTPLATSLQIPSSVTVAFAKRSIQMIRGKFSMLVTKSRRRLQKRKINVKDVQMFLVTMYSSPNSRDGSDMVITVIESAKTLDAIFRALGKYGLWDYFNYYLLQNIIEEFASDDDELNRMVTKYQKDLTGYVLALQIQTYLDTYLDAYEHSTTLSDNEDSAEITTLSPQQKRELFKKLTVKVKANVTDHSLAYVNYLWQSLATQFALPRPAMILHKVAEGCIGITLLIPANLVEHVTRMAQKTSNMFAEKQILRVMLEERCLYPMETKSSLLDTQLLVHKLTAKGNTNLDLPTSAVKKGGPPLEMRAELEQEPLDGKLRLTPPQYRPSSDKYIFVIAPFQELAEALSIRHRLRLHPLIISEETENISGYSQHVESAVNDDNCQVVYIIWGHNMEEASQVAHLPVSELVRELVSRPHSATELKKVVFVQLGSKSTVPLSTMIHQFSLEPSPSDEHFNAQECANSIYDLARDLQRSDDVDTVVAQKSLPTSTDTPPPEPSPLPLSYRTDTDMSLDLMKAELQAQKELVGDVRELRKQVANISVKQGDKVVVGDYNKQDESLLDKFMLKVKLFGKKIFKWRRPSTTTKSTKYVKKGGPLPEVKGGPLPEVKEGGPLPEVKEGGPLPEVKGGPLPEVKEGGPLPEVKEGSPLPEVKEGGPLPEVKEGGPLPEVKGGPLPEVKEGGPLPEVKEGGPLPEVKGGPLPEVKEGGPLPEVKVDVELPTQRYMPPPTFHPCPTTDKFILIVTQFKELADELSNKHGLPLRPPILPEETIVLSNYSQRVYSALFDNNCQVVYFIWSHSMEEASKVTDPPVSELVKELVSRPHSVTDLKKVVLVQLGSKSTVPMSTLIHQFSLEPSPSDEHFNVQECAKSIYDMARDLQRSDDLQRNDDVDTVEGATQRIIRTLQSEVTPTELSPPQDDTPTPSSQPPSYTTAMNTGGLESRSTPAIGQSRVVEQLRVTESASVGNSQILDIMKAQLAAQQELVEEVRKLRKTIGDTTDKHSEKVLAAIQGDRRTTTEQLVHTVDTLVQEAEEGVQDLCERYDDTTLALGIGLQDLSERFDEATLVQESLRENQTS